MRLCTLSDPLDHWLEIHQSEFAGSVLRLRNPWNIKLPFCIKVPRGTTLQNLAEKQFVVSEKEDTGTFEIIPASKRGVGILTSRESKRVLLFGGLKSETGKFTELYAYNSALLTYLWNVEPILCGDLRDNMYTIFSICAILDPGQKLIIQHRPANKSYVDDGDIILTVLHNQNGDLRTANMTLPEYRCRIGRRRYRLI